MYDWVFEALLILLACGAIALLVLGSIFGFTHHSKRRRRHRHKRRNANHRMIDLIRSDAGAAETGEESRPPDDQPRPGGELRSATEE